MKLLLLIPVLMLFSVSCCTKDYQRGYDEGKASGQDFLKGYRVGHDEGVAEGYKQAKEEAKPTKKVSEFDAAGKEMWKKVNQHVKMYIINQQLNQLL